MAAGGSGDFNYWRRVAGLPPAPAPAPAQPSYFTPGVPGGQPIPGGGSGLSPEDELRRQREIAFARLAPNQVYGGADTTGANAQLLQSLQGTLGGQGLPFTPEVQANLLARQGDASAAAHGQEQQRARSFFAANGMGGGGGELAALAGADRAHAARMQQARNQVLVSSTLENFGAQERARSEIQQYLHGRSAAEAPFALKAADLGSRFEVTGQSPTPSYFAAGTNGGTQNSGLFAVGNTGGRAGYTSPLNSLYGGTAKSTLKGA